VSTGLSRPDFFNWPAYVNSSITPVDGSGVSPDIAMVMFGGNDAQNMPAFEGDPVAVVGSPEWQTLYRKRVGDMMDLLKGLHNDRLVIWIGVPAMAPGKVTEADQMNYIYATEAAKRPWVTYFDTWPFFTDASGAYAKSLPSADGSVHVQRANDGVHLSTTGADRLATALYEKLGTMVDLTAVPFVPDPASAAPPTVVERPQVPPGAGSIPAA
jgi:hypothetical protein